MARTAEKVTTLVKQDGSMADALEVVLETAENGDGSVTWGDVKGEITSGEWGRLIEKGILVEGDGEGFVVNNPDEVRKALDDSTGGTRSRSKKSSKTDSDTDSSWSQYDKAAALLTVGLFAGYSYGPVRDIIGETMNALLGPLESMLPFYVVVMVLALFTGLYSTLLQANLMDMDKMGEYQAAMKEIQERRKAAQERGDDAELERIQQEQMDAMGDNLGMFKEQFRPMVWIMLLTIPVFLWMYWKLLTAPGSITPAEITLPLIGTVGWQEGVLGPLQAWILWYFVCSVSFTQIIRKSLNIQTTPT
ncbi:MULTISPECIES: DUF106 domain-containing protein [unclassified Haladaptatus]|uniref:DUF106 domain-containing protein n=1 Tax=unclassified Haladaptatus TaxID=2622732 RepID=UPI0023E84876|nr:MULTISPECIES: DUF106 domain-containing protein [unclassified Haladaptatus]